jgi:hypothetical protein
LLIGGDVPPSRESRKQQEGSRFFHTLGLILHTE